MFSRMMGPVATALGLMVLSSGSALAADQIAVGDTGVFPESITSDKAGDVIFGSMGKGGVYRAKPGETTASLWIDPKVSGITFMAGVFADDASNTLYACSGAVGSPPDQAAQKSAVRAFDLKTGAAKASYPMPYAGKSFCNDFAVNKAGDVYVTDTIGGAVHRLKKGASALEVWIKDPKLAGADGIAIGGDAATITPIKENEPGLTAMTVARGKVWANNAKLNYMQDPTLRGKDPGPFMAEAVDIPK